MEYRKLDDWRTHPELSRLSDLRQRLKNLFFCGEWNPKIFAQCVAIVGSRRITEYGRRVIEKMVPRLVFEKKTIISGFMYGVDQYAHRVCLENGGITIAVLGWGIRQPLSAPDQKLAQSIISSGGLLISEWEAQRPTLWTFPQRNRIVAALSEEIIVVEAATRSGSLITARMATQLKRKLWAVPGPVTSPTSVGTNTLISHGIARMWLGSEERREDTTSDPILNVLAGEPMDANTLARALERPVSEVGAQLSLLALTGQVIERGGTYYLSYAHKN